MEWDVILTIIVMGLIFFGIDMLVAKINPTAGRIVSVLTFFVFMPVGLAAGIVALVCISKKAKKNADVTEMPAKKIEPKKKKYPTKRRRVAEDTKATSCVPKASMPASKPNPGDEKEWKLEYATSIDDLHMRMIGYPFPESDDQNKQSEKLIELVIPEGTTEIRNYEYENRKDIASVVIPEGVKTIGKYAFCGCSNLESVKLLRGVDCIMDSAFKNCKKLKRIGNVWNVNEIAETAFSGCDSINQDDSFDINRIIATARDIERGEKWPGKDYDLSYDPYGPRNWH
ncbi:MAG: leucine-rich repeat domain-containing protein [Clostridia bacterium]|nr:leucine-rich repeat domain-containing protein [Clostridia bacterium]